MNLLRKLTAISLISIILALNICPIASANTSETNNENITVNSQEYIADALNPAKEQEALNNYLKTNSTNFNSANGLMKLTPNEPIILTFDDGSSIEYRLIATEESISPSYSNVLQSGKKTYRVEKFYNYLIGNARIYLTAECTQNNRRVTINRAYDDVLAVLASVSNRQVRIIKANGYNNTLAVAECSGDIQFEITKVGPWHQRSYRIQIHVDPIGAAYLKVLM